MAAYYHALISGDRGAAEQMVVPESRADFRQLRLDALMASKVDSIELPPSSDSAVVTTLRSYRFQTQILDMDFRENWKLIDGQWYLVLPNMRDQETPFGKMDFPGTVDPKAMEELVNKQNKQADPDQVIKALQRVQKTENQKEAAALAAAEAKKHPEQKPPQAIPPQPEQPPEQPPAVQAAPPQAQTEVASPAAAKAEKSKKKSSKPADKPDKSNPAAPGQP